MVRPISAASPLNLGSSDVAAVIRALLATASPSSTRRITPYAIASVCMNLGSR